MSAEHTSTSGEGGGEKKGSHKRHRALPATVVNLANSDHAISADAMVDDSLDGGNSDSEERNLMIADMQEDKDTDDTERESGHSDDEEQGQLIFNGTMTRRQSKQFHDADGNFAVFSVRMGSKSKNRTCEYCGVVKATPAALVRHIRKHTGEKPFVCQLCGKAYKAKRSLNLHQNSHHKDGGQMVTQNSVSLPTQIPLVSPILSTSATPAISEATKSLLRETLESSRKARDVSSISQAMETLMAISVPSRLTDRLPTPNLVNLLTSDIPKKVQHMEELRSLTNGALNLSKSAGSELSIPYSFNSVKKELKDEEAPDHMEEQAQDLSMPTWQKSLTTAQQPPVLDRKFKCELCSKSFKNDISRCNHLRTAHNIIISGTFLTKQQEAAAHKEVKISPATPLPSHAKAEPLYSKQESPTDLSILSRKLADSASASGLDNLKMESPGIASNESMVLSESDALPYHVTSRMVQDFDVEKLIIKGIEKAVLAEDGGNRRLRMTVSRETVLATRLDGINSVTGRQATAFKCHLCSRVFSSMLRFHHHLPAHFDTEVHTFDCRFCEASFRSLPQIVKHLQCHREKFTGLSPAGTNLNSSFLLLEEYQKKHKLELPQGSAISSSPASYFSPALHSDESMSRTSPLEPGERVNGGYSCSKCRKSFTREYLLQRHMRVHQSQNMFYCSECEAGFSLEVDLLDHKRKAHDFRSPDQTQYSSLLKNVTEVKPGSRPGLVSDSNNNSSPLLASGVFPLVDMKAIDLRRGEEVEVRVTSEEQRLLFERYQALMLTARGNEHLRKAFTTAAQEELQRKKMAEESKRLEAEKEARRAEESEKRRKIEQEKLKQKLAQEGMGDVTVVLPDGPSPDDERPTDLSLAADPPSGIGFMARKSVAKASSMGINTVENGMHSQNAARDKQGLEIQTKKLDVLSSLKRPLKDCPASNLGPSQKNRRKAHKPQKINSQVDRMAQKMFEVVEDNNNNKTLTGATLSTLQGLIPNMNASKGTPKVPVAQTIPVAPTIPVVTTIPVATTIPSAQTIPSAPTFPVVPTIPVATTIPVTKTIPVATAIPLTQTLPITPTIPVIPNTPVAANVLLVKNSLLAATSLTDGLSVFNNNNKKTKNNNNGNIIEAMDLSTDGKNPPSTTHQPQITILTVPPASSLSPPPPDAKVSQQEPTKKVVEVTSRSRSVSVEAATFESDSSDSQDVTSAADMSKTSPLTIQIPTAHEGQPAEWKPGQLWSSEASDSLAGVFQAGLWNGKGGKPVTYGSRTSSPSPAPSPTNSDASSSAESRKFTTTSLSRTHSRLSIVHEPLDRHSLCKPQVLEDGRSVYTCVICHKQFLSLSDINRHMDFHEDIRPYKCKYCDYYARTNSQLKVHKLRHEGVREFCCRVCNYKGVTQSDLNRHMKSQVHLLRSNHVCSQCGEGFVTPKTLRDHVSMCSGMCSEKSFENSATSDLSDDINNNDDSDEEELTKSEASQGSSSCSGAREEVRVESA